MDIKYNSLNLKKTFHIQKMYNVQSQLLKFNCLLYKTAHSFWTLFQGRNINYLRVRNWNMWKRTYLKSCERLTIACDWVTRYFVCTCNKYLILFVKKQMLFKLNVCKIAFESRLSYQLSELSNQTGNKIFSSWVAIRLKRV